MGLVESVLSLVDKYYEYKWYIMTGIIAFGLLVTYSVVFGRVDFGVLG